MRLLAVPAAAFALFGSGYLASCEALEQRIRQDEGSQTTETQVVTCDNGDVETATIYFGPDSTTPTTTVVAGENGESETITIYSSGSARMEDPCYP